ncbi:MAG TPA: glycoside hydrolase family 6 protein [Polyangiaceae bacterium]|nr:glycoside hydrolase family 6 protein [Polyangiaceae bacterium]
MRIASSRRVWISTLALIFVAACSSNQDANSDQEVLGVVSAEVQSADNLITATLKLETWAGGYNGTVTITNNGSTPTSSWLVRIDPGGSSVTNLWSAVAPARPITATFDVKNESYNGSIPAKGSVQFGFSGSGTGTPQILSVSQVGASGGSGSGGGGSGGSSSGGSSSGGATARGGSSSGGTVGAGGSTSRGGSASGGSASGGSGAVSNTGNPFAGASLYVETNSLCAQNAKSDSRLNTICQNPQGDWVGNWSGDPASAVRTLLSAASGKLRTLVAYNIYRRDCGGASSGGAASPAAYRTWIDGFASGIGNSPVAVILEPDALAFNCNNTGNNDSTLAMLKYAVEKIEAQPNAAVYIDAGHPNWISVSETVNRLKQAGIATATGFSLNVSNFYSTDSNISHGRSVAAGVGNKPFVIDTSRNGLTSSGSEWCNPRPRGLGKRPTGNTGQSGVHAFLWVKRPGESDGACNGGPAAGQWYNDYALHLIQNAQL